MRPLDFVQAVFWFQATFVSDQKEQEVLPVGLDLHYGRQVRHLDRLLDRGHLSETPAAPRPEARRLSLAAAYPLARAAVVPTVSALANSRARETGEQAERQVARMVRDYADCAELEEQLERARGRGDGLDALPVAAKRWSARNASAWRSCGKRPACASNCVCSSCWWCASRNSCCGRA